VALRNWPRGSAQRVAGSTQLAFDGLRSGATAAALGGKPPVALIRSDSTVNDSVPVTGRLPLCLPDASGATQPPKLSASGQPLSSSGEVPTETARALVGRSQSAPRSCENPHCGGHVIGRAAKRFCSSKCRAASSRQRRGGAQLEIQARLLAVLHDVELLVGTARSLASTAAFPSRSRDRNSA
jgi:hypothetical protein